MTSWIREFLIRLKTQEMCDEAVSIEPLSLVFVPDHLKKQETCNEAVHREPYTLLYLPHQYKTQEMCVCVGEGGNACQAGRIFSYSQPF